MSGGRAVIFDMDGVIVDSEPRHERAFLEVIAEIGYGGRHGLRFADYVGRSDRVLWEDFVALNRPPQTLEKLLQMKQRRTLELIRREQPLFEGLPELVARLAPQYKLAVASGSDRPIVEEVLALKGIGKFFLVTVCGSEVQHGKPSPDIFLKSADLLGILPKECWVIEDSKPGVAAGLAAGMRVIAIPNTHPPGELSNADYVVGSYEEIGKLLMGAR